MEKNIADVSIVVANYNNGPYLKTFIDSVIGSTMLPKELIIVDDGSKDDSASQIEAYQRQQEFITFIRFQTNRGFANALNEALQQATGKYIMRVDPDDYIAPSRIEEQHHFLESNPDVAVIGSNISYFDSASGDIIFNSNVPLVHEAILKAFRKGSCGIIHGSIMCRSVAIKRFGYNQEHVPAEDYELFSLMLRAGYKTCNLSKPLTFVRIHINSISNNLPFDTIKKTFQLKKKIWNTENNLLTVRRVHLHLYYYRKFLFCKGKEKYVYLFISALLHPMKFFSRLISFL